MQAHLEHSGGSTARSSGPRWAEVAAQAGLAEAEAGPEGADGWRSSAAVDRLLEGDLYGASPCPPHSPCVACSSVKDKM